MKPLLIAAALLAAALATGVQARGTFESERGGWMLGMFVGEARQHPYPFITKFQNGSDARAKGLRPGDELLKVDGQESRPFKPLFDRVNKYRPGKLVSVWVRRGSQTIKVEFRAPRTSGAGGDDGDKEKKPDTAKPAEPPVVVQPVPAPGDN